MSSYKGNDVDVVILDKVTIVKKGAFKGGEIKSVIFPANIEKIDEKAFEGCKKLKSVVFTGNIPEFYTTSFSKCSKFTIEISEEITGFELDAKRYQDGEDYLEKNLKPM